MTLSEITYQYFSENAFLLCFEADDSLVSLNVTEQVSRLDLISLLLVPLDDGAALHGRRQRRHEHLRICTDTQSRLSLSLSLSLQVNLYLSSFYRPFSRWTWVSRYQNVSILDFVGAKDDGSGGNNWWRQLEL